MIMVLPVSRAGAILPAERRRGKFQGMMPEFSFSPIHNLQVTLRTTANAEGSVLRVHSLLVILKTLYGDVQCAY
jgi:hypothetical protein